MKYNIFLKAIVAILVLSLAPLEAQDATSRRTPVVEAFEKNKDAVVSISSKYIQEVVPNDVFGWGFDWDWPFRGRKVVIPSLGSGFIVNTNGYIVTNAHVVRRADKISVIMSDNSEYQAQKVAEDSRSDLALLKIDADKPLPTVHMGHSDDLMIGETVLAIGNPFGYQQTLTDGILSAIHRDVEISEGFVMEEMLQISAPINPGNSGGPLLNINGEVIGINTAIRKAAQGIGFAIPIDQLRQNLAKLLDVERLSRIDFGLTVSDVKTSSGWKDVKVSSVRAGSAAEKADIKVGDIITAVDGNEINSAIDFYLDIFQRQPNSTVSFKIARSSAPSAPAQTFTLNLPLHARPKPDGKKLAQQLFGMEVAVLTKTMIQRYQIAGNPGDIVVLSVERASPAYYARVEAGDIIIALDDSPIADIDHIGYKLETIKNGEQVSMMYTRTVKIGGFLGVTQNSTILRARSGDSETSTKKGLVDL